MTITIEDLRDRFRLGADDISGAAWSDEAVEQWIYEAISDFALHLPPTYSVELSGVAGTHVYDLPRTARGVISVEYPTDQQPPGYLLSCDRHSARFWWTDRHFDFEDRGREADDVPRLHISAEVATNDKVRVSYRGDYTVADPRDPTETCPVPEQYHHVLLAYVQWRSMQHELSRETQSPDSTTLLLSQLASNADRAMRAYHEALRRAQTALTQPGAVGGWRMDSSDRIY